MQVSSFDIPKKFEKAVRSLPPRMKTELASAMSELICGVVPPGRNLETLESPWKGCHGVRLNDKFRFIFEVGDAEVAKALAVGPHDIYRRR